MIKTEIRTPGAARAAVFLLLALLVVPFRAEAQDRPTPYPIQYPPGFERAIERGTRTTTGQPGPNYWKNAARYRLHATLSPASHIIRGEGSIEYDNNSPDTLDQLVVHLRQNIYRPGAVRNTALEVTGGLHLSRVKVNGTSLIEQAGAGQIGYTIDGTVMRIQPPLAIAPGETAHLDFSWSYRVHSEGPSPREGTDSEVFFIGYWYPQMSVYDDVQGWDVDPFRQWAEFYMDHADYDVRITVPEGWLVAATGVLQNPEDVLAPEVERRLVEAAQTRETVNIVAASERRPGWSTVRSATGSLTWRFNARQVRDFAFGTSDRYVWDATSATVGQPGPDGKDVAMIHAFYRPGTPAWERGAEFGQYAISFLSDLILPYPYPQMTSVEGVVGGGMEFPMITILGGNRTEQSLFRVSVHEISHMWFPMIVGSQETDFSWMDEGLTTFNTREAVRAFWPGEDPWAPEGGYFALAGTGEEDEVMRHGDRFASVRTLVAASYDKTGRMLHALRGLFGEERFLEAYRTYAERWAFHYPYPYDLFNTFEHVLGEDLDWFWRSMLYETWTLDHSLAGVASGAEGVIVTVEDKGLMPMPVLLEATYDDGRVIRARIPVEEWLRGNRKATALLPAGGIAGVEIDPGAYLPDVDRSNNIWTASGTGLP